VLTLTLVLLLALASARTVVLVFDDSGSMDTDGTDRFSPALYATQGLIGLLEPSDTLAVVRMSAPQTRLRLLPAANPQAPIQEVSQWLARGATPYASVQTAIANLKSLRREGLPDDEDYWLVVFTDGEFDEFRGDPAASQQRITSDLDDLRATFENRKLGILFLGIGPDAQAYANVWSQAGATTFVASDSADDGGGDGLAAMSSNQIIDAMFEIAALIAGRDPESSTVERGLRAVSGPPVAGHATLQVTTELPLKRLIVFEQGSTPSGLRVVGEASSFADGAEQAAIRVEGPLEIRARGLHASISSIGSTQAGQVLGPGTFTVAVTANTAVSPASIRFLPEVALGLDLTRDDGPAIRCVGDPLELFAAITNSGDGSRVSFESVRGVQIAADVVTPQGARQVGFAPVRDDRYAASTRIEPGLNEVSVTARYPGYFVLRSRVFLIEGVVCNQDAFIDLSRDAFEATARFIDGLQTVADFALSAPGVDAIRARLDLEIEGLPEGWVLVIGGQRIEAPRGRVSDLQLSAEGRVPATLSITSAAKPGRSEVRIRASSSDPLTRFARNEARFTTDLRPATFRVTPSSLAAVEVVPSAAAAFETVARERLQVEALDEGVVLAGSERLRVSVEGTPSGMQLTLAGATLSAAAPTVELALRDLADANLTLQRDRSFQAGPSAPLRLRFESLDPRVRLPNDSLLWPIGFVAPSYTLEPNDWAAVSVTRTRDALPAPIAELPLALRPATSARAVGDERLLLISTGLPVGVELSVAGARLSTLNPSAEVSFGALQSARVIVARNASYLGGSDALVHLRIESLDGRITLANSAAQLPLNHMDLDLNVVATDPIIPVPRTTATEFLSVKGTVRIEILSSDAPDPNSRITLRVGVLPVGIHFELAGQRLTDSGDTVIVAQREFPLTLRVFRSNAFRSGGDLPVTLTASSDDPAVVWTERSLTVTLRAEPRTIRIEPLDTPWSVSQSAMGSRFVAQVLIDGEPAAGDELAAWALAVTGDDVLFARGMPRLDPETGTIALALRRGCFLGVFCAPGLNAVGERVLSTEVRASADEMAQRDLRIAVTPVGWWWAWLWPLLKVLGLLLLGLLVYRFVTKPRFPHRGGFREIVGGFGANRPPPKYHPFANLLTAFERLNPLTPERIRFRGLTIQADSRLGQPLQLRVVRTSPNASSVRINGAAIGSLPERLIENDRITFPSGGNGLGASSSITYRVEGQ
jgi:hypothetical protein